MSWSAIAGESKGEVKVNPNDGLKYVWLPPGTFMMGCSPGDSECRDDEKPPHEVSITKGLWMGQTEATVGAYKRFALAIGRGMPPEPTFLGQSLNPGWGDESMPIVDVTWDDARDYCTWAGGHLPTEAEWEYAAGSFNMLGKGEQWVNDWFDPSYYQHSPSQDPPGPASGKGRVVRGGSWASGTRSGRISGRGWSLPDRAAPYKGFRCAGDRLLLDPFTSFSLEEEKFLRSFRLSVQCSQSQYSQPAVSSHLRM